MKRQTKTFSNSTEYGTQMLSIGMQCKGLFNFENLFENRRYLICALAFEVVIIECEFEGSSIDACLINKSKPSLSS